MTNRISRAQLLKRHPKAKAIAALDAATNAQKKITPGAINLKKGGHKGETAVVLGSGVAGLTTAYELLKQDSGMKVIVLEALNRTGGRCLSLRTGDTLTEDKDSELFDSEKGETQVVRFKRPTGDAEPYLNAGPGRIPSGHKRLLNYLKKFGVDIEVYVMNSESNLVQMKKDDDHVFNGDPVVYRRLNHNTRGWVAQMVYKNADELIKSTGCNIKAHQVADRAKKLRALMIDFGELDKDGNYVVTAGEDGLENGKTRAGYTELPGVAAGKTASAIDLEDLLASEFWEKTRFYQPVDFLWQPTLFQPVGGMDQVQHAFAQQVATLGGTIHLNSPVKSVGWDEDKQKFIISVAKIGTEKVDIYEADYCFSNIAVPFLERILSPGLQKGKGKGFSNEFKAALDAVYDAQFSTTIQEEDENGKLVTKPRTAEKKYLACTTKVGWQADRSLWQGSNLTMVHSDSLNADTSNIPDSEVGVVPIYGGISWTENDITQIWYPSTAYHDEKGILTGAYNFGEIAADWGTKPVQERLAQARTEASDFGKAFGEGLHDGLAIAWQNMPHIKGGWAQWDTVEEPVLHFNNLAQGTTITNSNGTETTPKFFVIGDQLSSLPGWQEGAIASALNALSRMERPDLAIPYLAELPNTKLMVEGV